MTNDSQTSKKQAGVLDGRSSTPARTHGVPTSQHDEPTRLGVLPQLSLPKGGGAIRGMSEQVGVSAATGTSSLVIPIPTSSGRSGFGPQLSLSYDSANGNGPFGFGWSMSLPAITRKTDKCLPRYEDASDSDVYALAGSDELVPELQPDGAKRQDDLRAAGFAVRRYRPRVEGTLARVERWTELATGDVHWRSISRDNVTTIYGRDRRSRIGDPDASARQPARVTHWLICASYDDVGNAVVYEYVSEDAAGVDLSLANERNRSRGANRYLKRIKYGNRTSRLVQPDLDGLTWSFEVVLDYDEGHYLELPTPPPTASSAQPELVRASVSAARPWSVRPDPFSSYRGGFELRCYRRCRRVLMFHHLADLDSGPGVEPSAPRLVQATELDYRDLDYSSSVSVDEELSHRGSTRIASFIRTVTQCGFVRDDAQPVFMHGDVQYVTYLRRALPPLTLDYSRPEIHDQVRSLRSDASNGAEVADVGHQWVDLDGEGLPGMLVERAGAWHYQANLGQGRIAAPQVLRAQPALFARAGDGTQLIDLSGNGRLDMASFSGPVPGFFERDRDGWADFRPFQTLPNLSWNDPKLRFVDLDGDGHADILIAENEVFTWYPSLGERGFGPGRQVPAARDEERGPRLVLAHATESIYLADLSGDGLGDLVRIRNGEICYWPNLGYGRFGAKVTMDGAPRFDDADQFDQRRIRLADVDGSGTTDIIYLHRAGTRVYFNQAGNRWSNARQLSRVPLLDNLTALTVVDLLGSGTACLVWSTSASSRGGGSLCYVDLMGGQKPHLLTEIVNNLGSETRIQYAPSTKFYLADKLAGKPWVSRLPFPVQVVERITTSDLVSGNRFVTRYGYHHGYFDDVEREFRGFGMVEQQDSEQLPVLADPTTAPAATNQGAAFHVPPVLTKTWFHTGSWRSDGGGPVDHRSAGEHYPGTTHGGQQTTEVPVVVLPSGLTAAEEREASRALKGAMLRREVYALDGSDKAGAPYSVVEQTYGVVALQRRGSNPHGVFLTHQREAVSHHFERELLEPRVEHELTLQVDSFGNPLRVVTIAYGRAAAVPDPSLTPRDQQAQTTHVLEYVEKSYTQNDVATDLHHHRAPLPAETVSYELSGFAPETGRRFTHDEWTRDDFAQLRSAVDIRYEDSPDRSRRQRRKIAHVRTLYRKDDLTAWSALGKVESRALPGQTLELALTPSLLAHSLTRVRHGSVEALLPEPDELLRGGGPDQGGYVAIDGDWWRSSERIFFAVGVDAVDPARTAAAELQVAVRHFFLPQTAVDQFGQVSTVEYDAADLLVVRTIDAVGNRIDAVNDYRVLRPRLMVDANRNQMAVAFDALGLVVASATMGKEGQNVGDRLAGIVTDPTAAELKAFLADPRSHATRFLGSATTRTVYDVERYRREGKPALIAVLAREVHWEPLRDGQSPIQVAFSYTDGLGREIQRKVQAEPGPLPGEPTQGRRWVGTGWTVFNNKGQPVRQYEPFFSSSHEFENEAKLGVSPVLFYDPMGRMIAVLHPNHTYEKIVFGAWRRVSFDLNDTVLASDDLSGDPRTDADIAGYVAGYFETQPATWATWHASRVDGSMGPAEQDAALKAGRHANTPTTLHLDVLGRSIATVTHNRYSRQGSVVDEKYGVSVELDIQGRQRAVRDGLLGGSGGGSDDLGRLVASYQYDMVGNVLRRASMEAGESWFLSDVSGAQLRLWDSRLYRRRMSYDALRRPTELHVEEGGAERLVERTVYGEGQGDALNHRGRVFQRFDEAGVVTYLAYDFKGNLLQSARELLRDYELAVDWQGSPERREPLTNTTRFDALNRPVERTLPDGSSYAATFNEANLLERIEVRIDGRTMPIVTAVDYDAEGRRLRIAYGNGCVSEYRYDPLTLRLVAVDTTRPTQPESVVSQLFNDASTAQALRYTYDPVGNITRLEDAALRSVVRNGEHVEPVGRYTYDAAYRLIEAEGREHVGQNVLDLSPINASYRDYPFVGRAHPNDLQALRNYRQSFEYSAAGNLDMLRHRVAGGGWTRSYFYAAESLLQPGTNSNRLTKTTLGNGSSHTERYAYDAHGNVTTLPALSVASWDFRDQLRSADLGGGGAVHYGYDSAGQRVRKVIEAQNGKRKAERLYLGELEIFREYQADGVTLLTERKSLSVFADEGRCALIETQTIRDGSPVPSPQPLHRYHLGNHLGSVCMELDERGALCSYEEYHPFGTTSFQAGPSGAEVSAKRYRFTTKERDEESGLYYHGARYYAPWLGRWISCDPSGLVDGTNAYQYVRGNPVAFKDPTGRETEQQRGLRLLNLGELKVPYLEQFATTSQTRTAFAVRRLDIAILKPGSITRPGTVKIHELELKMDNPDRKGSLASRTPGQAADVKTPVDRVEIRSSTTPDLKGEKAVKEYNEVHLNDPANVAEQRRLAASSYRAAAEEALLQDLHANSAVGTQFALHSDHLSSPTLGNQVAAQTMFSHGESSAASTATKGGPSTMAASATEAAQAGQQLAKSSAAPVANQAGAAPVSAQQPSKVGAFLGRFLTFLDTATRKDEGSALGAAALGILATQVPAVGTLLLVTGVVSAGYELGVATDPNVRSEALKLRSSY